MATDQPQQAWTCTLEFHDDTFSHENVVLNIDNIPGCTLQDDTLAKLAVCRPSPAVKDFQATATANAAAKQPAGASNVETADAKAAGQPQENVSPALIDYSKTLVFVVRQATAEQKSKRPGLQISIHASIKVSFAFSNRMQIAIFAADRDVCTANFVELAFRDQYLARSDMWRLTVSELSHRAVIKGQQLLFMGTINATVKNIFVSGKKVTSALVSPLTVPIFRSESARYVFFIQMSREMWDYDGEGSGEIMFNKVINGFLPDLFKRWQKMNVRHLVSIILFARLEYEQGVLKKPDEQKSGSHDERHHDEQFDFRDYYKVVTTDMASGDWVRIMYDLRKEFKVFLRDTLILSGNEAYGRRPDSLAEVKTAPAADSVIAGRPTAAAKGNVLEAINLASSQFAQDYIDRDLVRTGISLVIVTAGTGVFEVDYNMLKLTTDTLVGNGIGIDLVSVASMPLHSVPLFGYRTPQYAAKEKSALSEFSQSQMGSTPRPPMSFAGLSSSPLKHSKIPKLDQPVMQQAAPDTDAVQTESEWSFAIPHWVDVSFWTGTADDDITTTKKHRARKIKHGTSTFKPTCRMYELQMMGLMENEMTDISLPFLPLEPQIPKVLSLSLKPSLLTQTSTLSNSFTDDSSAGKRMLVSGTGSSSPTKASRQGYAEVDVQARQKLIEWMQRYDQETFGKVNAAPLLVQGVSIRGPKTIESLSVSHAASLWTDAPNGSLIDDALPSSYRDRSASVLSQDNYSIRSQPGQSASDPKKSGQEGDGTKRKRAPRQFSLGPKGLGLTKGTASTGLTSAEVTPTKSTAQSQRPTAFSAGSGILSQQLRSTLKRKPSHQSISSAPSVDREQTPEERRAQASQPIKIKDDPTLAAKKDPASSATVKPGTVIQAAMNASGKTGDKKLPQIVEKPTVGSLKDSNGFPRTISPLTAMSPWLTLLNPSNPKKDNMSVASHFRRWQHVFPKPIPTSAIKWKSLCSPAALPLTSEYFPLAEELKEEYIGQSYKVSVSGEDEMAETKPSRESLLRELVGSRLSNGFQIVVGDDARRYSANDRSNLVDLFDPQMRAIDQSTVLMSVGNNFHQLLCVPGDCIEVRRYVRKPAKAVDSIGLVDPFVVYQPRIRNLLAETYKRREFIFRNPRSKYDWELIDAFISGRDRENLSPDLRFWRARFVLIPVDLPRGVRGPLAPLAEVSEEETRLEGIQRLTQMWQRFRYVPPDERRYQASVQRWRKDPNPLAIDYQTRDPSAVVRAHASGIADSLLHGEVATQLFAEAELYHTNDFDLQKLSQHLQSPPPKGLNVVDRRWHFKLYYRCFRGDELTSWLLVNFKDMETRENAVKLGNELMKKGLFIHVQHKHHFRDGNYFYQFAMDFRRTPYPDSRSSWFSRMTDRSVPSTPALDGPKNSPFSEKSRSRPTTDDSSDESGPGTPTRRPKLQLSRVLQYDVDHRKRSHRPEIINLHYDRIHNPDNCYHIRIDWMNVTAKLIEDAIVTWATSVERYGLRLVEVPIAEACTITDQNPFRAPYKVHLVVQPPAPKPRQHFFDTTSFAPQAMEERFPYQKALLRKWDFVLDLEAAKNFEGETEVSYSWGAPDYKYTQFVHKSGMVVAEIDDDGNFLLLANRLCVNRAASARDAGKFERMEYAMHDRRSVLAGGGAGATTTTATTTGGGGGGGGGAMAAALAGTRSPFSSPLVRAVDPGSHNTYGRRDASSSSASMPPPPPPSQPSTAASTTTTAAASNVHALEPSTAAPATSTAPAASTAQAPTQAPAAETLLQAFERFCHDEAELIAFYDDALRPQQPASPSPRHTPVLRSTSSAQTPQQHPSTSHLGTATGAATAEANIPALGLPPILNPSLRAVSYGYGVGHGYGVGTSVERGRGSGSGHGSGHGSASGSRGSGGSGGNHNSTWSSSSGGSGVSTGAGAGVGDDGTYSGTVGGSREGLLGRRASTQGGI